MAPSMSTSLGSRNFPSEMAKTHLAKSLGLAEVWLPPATSVRAWAPTYESDNIWSLSETALTPHGILPYSAFYMALTEPTGTV